MWYKTAFSELLILCHAHLWWKLLKLALNVFQRINLVFVSNAYHKTRNQWLLHTSRQSSWAPFKRTDFKFSNLVMPSWQWKENTSANDSHLFLPKTTVMGMLLQPHTPGAKTLRTPSKTEPSQERKKHGWGIVWVRRRSASNLCRVALLLFIFPCFFPCGPNTTGPNKETEMWFNEVHKSVLFAANSERHLMRLQILPFSFAALPPTPC